MNDNHVRYVVVGGLATVLHGFARLTADIDMIVDLDPLEARPDLIDMKRLAGRPEDLLDIEALQEIQRRKGTRR